MALIIFVVGYIAYMQINYYRIEDNQSLEITNNKKENLKTGKNYSAVTYNIGFGAYDHDYSFFMDTGKMEDGTDVVGEHSRAASKENALKNTNGSTETVKKLSPDFALLQEVDVKATRSYKINQKESFEKKLPNYSSIFALNFHAPYMLYPLNEPHGSVEAGLLTMSKYEATSATRKSYPVDESSFTKFFDLDRCFTMVRYPVENNKELVLINNHMSAYDEGGTIRVRQLKLLNKIMEEEYKKGNYVIVGGDFNHALGGTIDAFDSKQQIPEWVFKLNDEDIVKGMSVVKALNNTEVPTCRSCDIPYEKGVNYTSVLDGFIVSDNVVAKAENVDKDFTYSDHNPVKLTFKLK
ncbi:hypothetical protein SDC9_118788 [bioreactor metagenome]|uniref:Endonuclease/exonuclease/phosphatase domain-containing protein n=1 Tax=bioreactor metagenome TaxID=1076179 RepID=A0A645C3N4_9ZZZZ